MNKLDNKYKEFGRKNILKYNDKWYKTIGINTKRKCGNCNQEFPATPEYFYKCPNSKYGLSSRCKVCYKDDISQEYRQHYRGLNKERIRKRGKEYRQNNKEHIKKKKKEYYQKHRLAVLVKRHNITIKQYNKILLKQNYRCKICGNNKRKFHIDHSHKTGKFRGLLCSKCNSVLGFANDNPLILINSIKYLKNFGYGIS